MRPCLPIYACGLALLLSACHSNIKPLEPIQSVEQSCRQGAPKGPGIMSIMASIADQPPLLTKLTTRDVERQSQKVGGVIAHWNDLELYLPNAAKLTNNPTGYLHVTAAAIDTPAPQAQSRTVLVLLQGSPSSSQRWYKATAFDIQSPCIEGSRQS